MPCSAEEGCGAAEERRAAEALGQLPDPGCQLLHGKFTHMACVFICDNHSHLSDIFCGLRSMLQLSCLKLVGMHAFAVWR